MTPATADTISRIGNFSPHLLRQHRHRLQQRHRQPAPRPVRPRSWPRSSTDRQPGDTTPTSTCTSATPCSFQVREYLPTVDSPVSRPARSPPPSTRHLPVLPRPSTRSSPTCSTSSTTRPGPGALRPSPSSPMTSSNHEPNRPSNSPPPRWRAGPSSWSPATAIRTGTPNVSLTSCAAPNPAYPTCPADAIQSVGIDLMIGGPGSGTNGNVENQLIVYRTPQESPVPTDLSVPVLQHRGVTDMSRTSARSSPMRRLTRCVGRRKAAASDWGRQPSSPCWPSPSSPRCSA